MKKRPLGVFHASQSLCGAYTVFRMTILNKKPYEYLKTDDIVEVKWSPDKIQRCSIKDIYFDEDSTYPVLVIRLDMPCCGFHASLIKIEETCIIEEIVL